MRSRHCFSHRTKDIVTFFLLVLRYFDKFKILDLIWLSIPIKWTEILKSRDINKILHIVLWNIKANSDKNRRKLRKITAFCSYHQTLRCVNKDKNVFVIAWAVNNQITSQNLTKLYPLFLSFCNSFTNNAFFLFQVYLFKHRHYYCF